MSGFNGSGVFSISGSGLPYVAGTTISSTVANTLDSDLATGLSTVICKDGQTTITADIPLSGFKLTGVGAGTASKDASNVQQQQQNANLFAAAGGTAQAITATYSPANTALTDGMELCVRALLANTATAPTFTPDGLSAHPITKLGGVGLRSGDIAGPLHELRLRYNLANTRWELINPAYGLVVFPVGQTPVNITNGGAAVLVGSGSSGTWKFSYDFGGGNAFSEFVNHSQFIVPGVYGTASGGSPGTRTYDSSSGNLTLSISGAPGNIVGLSITQIV